MDIFNGIFSMGNAPAKKHKWFADTLCTAGTVCTYMLRSIPFRTMPRSLTVLLLLLLLCAVQVTLL
jgi:hypothetical protein